MTKRLGLFVFLPAVLFVAVAGAQQFPLLDQVADKVVQKYKTSTCEQLWEKKAQPKQPPTAEEQKVIAVLKSDPAMRAEFINRIAAPIANKMFECGLIP